MMRKKPLNFSLVLILIITMFALTGCGSKTSITADEFIDKMEEQGLIIIDATDQFEEGVVDSVTIAMADVFQIEYYIVPTEDQAIEAFEENKQYFESVPSNVSSNSSISNSNYSKYSRTTDEAYLSISRIDNTFIYILVPTDSKEIVSELVDLIGY